MTVAYGVVFTDPIVRPLSNTGAVQPLCYLTFYLTGTTTAANVYSNATLTTSLGNVVTADSTGKFQAIYLNPATVYRVQLHNAQGQLLSDTDPYVVPMNANGGPTLQIDAVGELTIPAPSGGGQTTLTLIAQGTSLALALTGQAVGQPALQINNSATTGSYTATFTATNKPGSGTTAPSKWLPINCDGGICYLPLWQ